MKTIKELEAGKKFAVERGQLIALKDVLGLIEKRIEEWSMILANLISLEENLIYQDELLNKIKAYKELKTMIDKK